MNANFLLKALLLGYSIERTDEPIAYVFIDKNECLNLITYTIGDINDYHTVNEIKEDLTDGKWIIGAFKQ